MTLRAWRRRHRRSRRSGTGLALLTALTLLVLLVLPGAPRPAYAGLSASPSPSPSPAVAPGTEPGLPVQVILSALQPAAPRAGGTVQVRGVIRNLGGQGLSDVRVRLRLSLSPLITRGEVATAATETGPFGQPVAGSESPVTEALSPGAAVAFSITLPVDDLGLAASGVYLFGVEVRGRVGQYGYLDTQGRLRTFLPFTGRVSGYAPSRLAWLWSLVSAPARAPDGAFLDERLAAEMAPGGRLDTLVAAMADARRRTGVPTTVAVDPALLQAAADMAAGYRVRPHVGGPTVPGRGRAVAAAWLERLRAAVRSAPVLSLPYADPDVVALVRAGLGDDVSHTVQTGKEITRRLLPTSADASNIGWPPDGLLTKPALDTLTGTGVDTVVLSGAALPLTSPLTYTPDAGGIVQTVGGTVRALVTDDTLNALVASGAGDARGPSAATTAVLDLQRFLAETLLITLEQPNAPRTIVITPPRQWNPVPAYADGLLTASDTAPWLQPLTVEQAAAGSTPAAADRGSLNYPTSALARELPPGYLRGSGVSGDANVASVRADLREFETVLVGTNAAVVALDLALFRLESVSWRSDPARAQQLLGDVRDGLLSLKNRVRIGTGGLITLTSRSGTIPVTVVNGLSQPVRLQLVLSSNAARVTTRSPGVQTIEAGHAVTVPVQTRAVRTSGVFPVYAELLTPDGRPYADRVQLLVRSTAYGAVALGITGGALAVLLLAAAVRLVRRALGGRRPASAR